VGAAVGAPVPSKAEKNFRHNLQGKFVSAPPGREKSQFLGHFLLGGEIWKVGVVHLFI